METLRSCGIVACNLHVPWFFFLCNHFELPICSKFSMLLKSKKCVKEIPRKKLNIFLALIILLGLTVCSNSIRVILIWPPLKSLGTVWGRTDIIVDSWVIWTYLKMFKLGGHDVSAFRQLESWVVLTELRAKLDLVLKRQVFTSHQNKTQANWWRQPS